MRKAVMFCACATGFLVGIVFTHEVVQACQCRDVVPVPAHFSQMYAYCGAEVEGEVTLPKINELLGDVLSPKGNFEGNFYCLQTYEYLASHSVCDGLTEVETRRCAPDGTYNVMLYDNGGCSFPLPKCKPPERNPDGDDQRSNEKGTNC